jgi:hypothetical protein
MVKNDRKIILFSALLIFLSSCSASPTYSRNEIDSVIKKICKEEYSLDVKAWDKGETLWIYAPFENIIDEKEKSKISQNIMDNIRRIFLSLRRVILSMDKPPKFYVFVFSDTKEIGADVYFIGFVPNLVLISMDLISNFEFQEREVLLELLNPEALGDKEGNHIHPYDLTMGEFISYLARQNMERLFTDPAIKDNFQINELRTFYENRRLGIVFNILTKDYRKDLPDPFEEAKKVIKKLLAIYESPQDVVEIEINDSLNEKIHLYTKKALLQER